jgi:hypothetical protein
MNENRRQILGMLAAGKIDADEAECLLIALELDPAGILLWLQKFVQSYSPAVMDVCPL